MNASINYLLLHVLHITSIVTHVCLYRPTPIAIPFISISLVYSISICILQILQIDFLFQYPPEGKQDFEE